jgi:hypothetical protein
VLKLDNLPGATRRVFEHLSANALLQGFTLIGDDGRSFGIMGEKGLFAMKSHVIHQRVRSRDLYDLKTFLMRGKTLADILQTASTADPACSQEYAKSVLVGDVPLDKEDEGFDSVGVNESIQDIYAFFKSVVNEYEQAIAEETAKNLTCSH